MTLTVVPSSTPGKINISGEEMDFTVTAQGGRVDITSPNHSVAVWMTENMANIRWSGEAGRTIWSSSTVTRGVSNMITNPVHMYGEIRHSLENTSSLVGERILYSNTYGFDGLGFSGDYFFVLYHDSQTQATVYRFDINTLTNTSITIPNYTDEMIVYDDNTVYVTGISDDDLISVWKFNFITEDYTLVGQFDYTTTYNGASYSWFGGQFASRCKYGSLDRLVYVSEFRYDDAYPDDHGEIICVCMFDLANDTETAQTFTDGGDGVWDFYDLNNSGVLQYQDKAIFNMRVYNIAEEYEGTLCGSPFFVVNLNTGAIYRGDDHGDTYPGWYEIFELYAAIDNTNGIYYFWVYEYDQNQYRVRKVRLDSFSPSAEVSSGWTDYYPVCINGTSNAYVDLTNNIYYGATVDDLTTVTLNPILADMTSTSYSRKSVDDVNNIAWAVNNDLTTLEGFSTQVGGSDTEIPIDWGAQSPPTYSRTELIMPYKGYCAMLIYVQTSGSMQGHNLYLFRPS